MARDRELGLRQALLAVPRFRSLRQSAVAFSLALGALGCPGGNTAKKPPEPCRELGQQCEFAPGKLGACSYRANCSGPGCLYCQSQH